MKTTKTQPELIQRMGEPTNMQTNKNLFRQKFLKLWGGHAQTFWLDKSHNNIYLVIKHILDMKPLHTRYQTVP